MNKNTQLFGGSGMLLGPSRTLLDGSWVKTSKSKQNLKNYKTTPTGNRTTPCQKALSGLEPLGPRVHYLPISQLTHHSTENRPQSSLFAQLAHHSTENINIHPELNHQVPEFIICPFSSSFNTEKCQKT